MACRNRDGVPRDVSGRRGIHRHQIAPRGRSATVERRTAAHTGGRSKVAQVEPVAGGEDGGRRWIRLARSHDSFIVRTWSIACRARADHHKQADGESGLTTEPDMALRKSRAELLRRSTRSVSCSVSSLQPHQFLRSQDALLPTERCSVLREGPRRGPSRQYQCSVQLSSTIRGGPRHFHGMSSLQEQSPEPPREAWKDRSYNA